MKEINQNTTNCCNNYIKETIYKIDKMQKQLISDSIYTCVSCNQSLLTGANNTIPVVLSSCVGEITGRTSTTTTSPYFRIESIRCNNYVTLRILEASDTTTTPTLVATEFTKIVDLDCITQIQCLEPITVELCIQSILNNANNSDTSTT